MVPDPGRAGTGAQHPKSPCRREGMSLSDFINRKLEMIAERPAMREWLEQTQQFKPISTRRSADQSIREMRDER